jgi:hypothetical protein
MQRRVLGMGIGSLTFGQPGTRPGAPLMTVVGSGYMSAQLQSASAWAQMAITLLKMLGVSEILGERASNIGVTAALFSEVTTNMFCAMSF